MALFLEYSREGKRKGWTQDSVLWLQYKGRGPILLKWAGFRAKVM